MKFARRLLIMFGLPWLLLSTVKSQSETCSGGLLVISTSSKITSAQIPRSTSANDFCDLPVSISGSPEFLVFDTITNLLYWKDNQIEIWSYPIDSHNQSDLTLFTTGRNNYEIGSLAIDESQRRLFWGERYRLGFTDHSIWYIPLDDDSNKVMIHTDNTFTTNKFINNIFIDTTKQTLYHSINGKLKKSNIDIVGNSLTNIQERTVSFGSIDVDVTAQKLYLANNCQICRLDLNDFLFGNLEKFFSGSCSQIGEIQLSLTENKVYYRDETGGIFKVPLSSANVVTPISVIPPIPQIISMVLVSPCPFDNTISFGSSKYIAYEGDTNFRIVVERTGSLCLDTVRLINYDVSATKSEDYSVVVDGDIQPSNSVTIPVESGENSIIEVSFEIYQDGHTEKNESFVIELVELLPIGLFQIGEISRVEVIIVDKTSFFQFQKDNYEVTEGFGLFPITVERVGNLEDHAQVSLITLPVTADADADYDPIIGDVFFTPYKHETLAFINIKDDQNLEELESVQVSFAKAQQEGRSTTIIFIKDNTIMYSFQQPSYEVSESIGEFFIPVERTGNIEVEGSISVNFSVILTDAEIYRGIRGKDYTEFNPSSISFTIGQSIANIYLHITDDNQREKKESFKISISDPQPDKSGIVINTTLISIWDDEANFKFSVNSITVTEGETSDLRLAINRDVAQEETSVRVTTCQLYQSAAEGEDYIPLESALVTFRKGETTAFTPNIFIINDEEGEANESFKVVITFENEGTCTDETNSDIYVAIQDDDGATYEFSNELYMVDEFSADFNIRIYKRGTALNDIQETVYLVATSGSAVIGLDFVFNGPIKLNFGRDKYADVLIQIISDTEYEQGDESFKLQLIRSDDYIWDSTTVRIIDDDIPTTPRLEQTYYFISANASLSEEETYFKFKVFRSQSLASAHVTIETVSGSAEKYKDFYPLEALTLQFSSGTVLLEETIRIVDDLEPEDKELFQVFLSSPSDFGQTGPPLTVAIIDNDISDKGESSMSLAVAVWIIAGTLILVVVVILTGLMCFCILSMTRRPPVEPVRPLGPWTTHFSERGRITQNMVFKNNISTSANNNFRFF